jgi:sporulation protein YlmC with PRC-barrel domain
MGHHLPVQDPPAPAATSASGVRIVGDPENPAGPGPTVMACDTLTGDPVLNKNAEELGKIDHIVIDLPSGRISYVVLAYGGVFGIGEKLFAVPWNALTLDAERRCFILDVSRESLESSPP